MNYINSATIESIKFIVPMKKILFCVFILANIIGVTACGSKEKGGGQTLARVNGEEITILQVNDELKRAGVKTEQQEAATKQILESLIDRQLVMAEAMRNKVDRTPEVVQAIERSKAQIITQAYLKSIVTKIDKPSKSEIDAYFQNHPEYFTQRKQFDIQQLIFPTREFSDELKKTIDSAKSLDTVAAWLDQNHIRYARGKLSRNTSDMPEPIVAKLKDMKKGQLFIVNEAENSMLNSISDIRISPVSEKDAAPQIEQYLINKKTREAAEAEVTHLRSSAKIEYLNAAAPAAK